MAEQISYQTFHAYPVALYENIWIEHSVLAVGGESPPADITHDLSVWIYAQMFMEEFQAEYREKFAAMEPLQLINYMLEEEGVAFTHVIWVPQQHTQTLDAFAQIITNYPLSDTSHNALAGAWLELLMKLGVYMCKLPTTE